MTAAKRILSACAAVLLATVLLCSVLFIAAEADHDCIGDNCPVCAQMELCSSILKTISKTAEFLFAAFTAAFFVVLISFFSNSVFFDNPVSLKTKLIN